MNDAACRLMLTVTTGMKENDREIGTSVNKNDRSL
jgi:hypothetical protein